MEGNVHISCGAREHRQKELRDTGVAFEAELIATSEKHLLFTSFV